MSMRIYKYKIELIDEPFIVMPANAKILHVDDQHGELFLWAEVDEDATHTPVAFRVYGTGHPLDKEHSSYTFIGSVIDSRNLVWHIYRK